MVIIMVMVMMVIENMFNISGVPHVEDGDRPSIRVEETLWEGGVTGGGGGGWGGGRGIGGRR